MIREFQIGEIARFFKLNTSTLRYWEECGVITPAKIESNQYRTYSVPDLMTVSDIIFYKSLGLPLKEIRQLESYTPCQQKQLFEGKRAALLDEKKELHLRIEKLNRHLSAMDTLESLKKEPYMLTDIDTACIVSFDLIEKEKLHRYIENPYLYSRVQQSDSLDHERRGLTIPVDEINQFTPDQILWKKTSSTYITFLMREEIKEGYPNDLGDHIKYIQKKYRTGTVISRFLLEAQENGKIYDFYKSFVEIIT